MATRKTKKQRRRRDLRNGLIMEIVVMIGVIVFFQPQLLTAFQTDPAFSITETANDTVNQNDSGKLLGSVLPEHVYPDQIMPDTNNMASFDNKRRY